MFRTRKTSLWIVVLLCATWLYTVEMIHGLITVELPKLSLKHIVWQGIMLYTQDNRIETLETQDTLALELRKWRKAMRPFVKSEACKIWVGGK